MRYATISLDDTEGNRDSLRPLVPEAEEGMRRVEVDLSLESQEIHLGAQDTRALRAALNSYLRWLEVTERICKDI